MPSFIDKTVIKLLLWSALLWSVPLSLYAQESKPCELKQPEYRTFGQRPLVMDQSIEATDRVLYKSDEVDFYDSRESIEVIIRKHEVRRLGSENPYGALINLPFYAKERVEQILDIRGFTHKSNGSRIPLDTSNIRVIDLNDRYKSIEFLMPQADSGDVVEFAYSLRRRFIEELPDFQLQESVPVDYARFQINYPDYIRFSVKPQNAQNIDLCWQEVRTDTSNVPAVFVYRRPPPQVQEYWEARAVPALPEQDLAGNVDDLKARLVSKMSEFGRPRQPLEISWEVVLARYRKEQRLFQQVEAWKSELSDSLKQAWLKLPEQTRILAVYHAVNDSLGLPLSFSSVPSAPQEIKKRALDQWTQADQNARLIAWLQQVGIQAEAVLAPIESAGRIRSGYPSAFKLNALLVRAQTQNGIVWLDGSLPAGSPNLLRRQNLDQDAIILRPRSHEWTRTRATESLFGVEAQVDASLDIQGRLKGTLKAVLRGYPAQTAVQKHSDGLPTKALVTQLFFDAYNLVYVDSARIEINEGLVRTVHVEAQFELPEYALSFADGLDIRPLVVGYRLENPLDADYQRVLPIQLDAPEYTRLDFSIKLPSSRLKHNLKSSEQIYSMPKASLVERYALQKDSLNYHFEVAFAAREYDVSLFDRMHSIYQRWLDLTATRWPLKYR